MGQKYITAEQFEYVTPDGESLKFDADGLRCLLTFEGFGMPPHKFITNRGPGQHGETVLGVQYETRMIQLLMRENGYDRFDYWDIRERLINMMRPDRQVAGAFQPGEFRVYLPDTRRLAIKVMLAQGLAFGARNLETWDEWGVMEVLRLQAHYPFWHELPGFIVTMTYTETPPTNLVFPFTFRSKTHNPHGNGMQLSFAGEPDFHLSYSFGYTGERAAFPVITIYGPVKRPVVANTKTNEQIKLNYNVAAGEVVTITLEYGNKVVTSSLAGDITSVVSDDSQFTTFHVAAPPESANGHNITTFSGTAPEHNVTKCLIRYKNAYTGI